VALRRRLERLRRQWGAGQVDAARVCHVRDGPHRRIGQPVSGRQSPIDIIRMGKLPGRQQPIHKGVDATDGVRRVVDHAKALSPPMKCRRSGRGHGISLDERLAGGEFAN